MALTVLLFLLLKDTPRQTGERNQIAAGLLRVDACLFWPIDVWSYFLSKTGPILEPNFDLIASYVYRSVKDCFLGTFCMRLGSILTV